MDYLLKGLNSKILLNAWWELLQVTVVILTKN